MSQAGTAILERVLDPVADCLTPEVARRLLDLKPDPGLQAPLEQLAVKSTAGELSPQERAEYEEYVEAMDIVAIFQARARTLVESTEG